MMTDWRPLAMTLAAEMTSQGVLAPDWRPAFEQTPRHLFVPSFYTPARELIVGDDPDNHDRWLASVYSDESLTTRLLPAPGTDLLWPTSSSTRPSLMARMLGLLDVAEGHRVLEIGTGTGYNAALLCHRLGDSGVTSVDIDPVLVEAARDRLAGLGHRPHLVASDGIGGVFGRAPFDRILATCGVPAIPPAWIAQLGDDGLIVVDLRGELVSSLIVVRSAGRHSVTGRFLATPGHFMWLRARADNPLRHGGEYGVVYDFTDPLVDRTGIPLTAFDDPDFRFVLQLAVPRLGPIGRVIRDGRDGVFIVGDGDMSWVEISLDAGRGAGVRYGGPRLLWPSIVDIWRRWNDWGRPERVRFGLTAHDDGRQQIWLDQENAVMVTDRTDAWFGTGTRGGRA